MSRPSYKRSARRAHLKDSVEFVILRHAGKPSAKLDGPLLREVERGLGIRKPMPGEPFSLEKGRMLRIILRLQELRLIGRDDVPRNITPTLVRLKAHLSPERRVRPVTGIRFSNSNM